MGLARHGNLGKRRKWRQEEVALAQVNPISSLSSSFIPMCCLSCFLLCSFKHFSLPGIYGGKESKGTGELRHNLLTAETLTVSPLSFVLEISTPSF